MAHKKKQSRSLDSGRNRAFAHTATLTSNEGKESRIGNRHKFRELVCEWRAARGATSSITEMAMLPAYQRIIGMGPDAVPLILAQLEAEGDDPDQWFWALRAITAANPVKPEDQGNTVKMAEAWLRWAKHEGYAR